MAARGGAALAAREAAERVGKVFGRKGLPDPERAEQGFNRVELGRDRDQIRPGVGRGLKRHLM